MVGPSQPPFKNVVFALLFSLTLFRLFENFTYLSTDDISSLQLMDFEDLKLSIVHFGINQTNLYFHLGSYLQI
jgi:hypothetical protein